MFKKILKSSIIPAFAFFSLSVSSQEKGNIMVYKGSDNISRTDVEIENEMDNILSQMTLEEKIEQITVDDFKSKANHRLGIPAFVMTDGPLGPRGRGSNTVFSAPINFAAAWDLDLIRRIGKAMGDETRILGFNLLLGPCINILRVPYGGRNFESFGEDPYLMAEMTVPIIEGIQSKNMALVQSILLQIIKSGIVLMLVRK